MAGGNKLSSFLVPVCNTVQTFSSSDTCKSRHHRRVPNWGFLSCVRSLHCGSNRIHYLLTFLTLPFSLVQLILHHWCHDNQIQWGKSAFMVLPRAWRHIPLGWGQIVSEWPRIIAQVLPPALLHEYSRIGQLWVVHSRICTSSVKILRTIFQIMENVETSCPHAQESQPLKPF